MPFDQDCKGELGGFASVGGEAFQKLAVAQFPDRADRVDCANLPKNSAGFCLAHECNPLRAHVRRHS